MIALRLGQPTRRPLEILCLGAHADDIEIGCGGTILSLIERNPDVRIHWCVFSGSDERRREAEASAETFCNGAAGLTVEVAAFDDG
jgi:LmbE family N-acetylglucosaminyl deacetylase